MDASWFNSVVINTTWNILVTHCDLVLYKCVLNTVDSLITKKGVGKKLNHWCIITINSSWHWHYQKTDGAKYCINDFNKDLLVDR